MHSLKIVSPTLYLHREGLWRLEVSQSTAKGPVYEMMPWAGQGRDERGAVASVHLPGVTRLQAQASREQITPSQPWTTVARMGQGPVAGPSYWQGKRRQVCARLCSRQTPTIIPRLSTYSALTCFVSRLSYQGAGVTDRLSLTNRTRKQSFALGQPASSLLCHATASNSDLEFSSKPTPQGCSCLGPNPPNQFQILTTEQSSVLKGATP